MLAIGTGVIQLAAKQHGRPWYLAPAYLLGGEEPSLVADFVRGRCVLDGAAKEVTDIITVSRPQEKWVSDPTGALEQVPPDTPAFGYGAGRRRLVVEGAGNNYITNNTMQGAAIGTPGARPSGWGIAVPAGLSYEITGVGSIGNRDYVDARFYGTCTTSGEAGIDPLNPAVIAGAAGQIWTHSAWCDVIAGVPPNTPQLAIFERTSGGSYLAGDRQNIAPFSTRMQLTRTLTNGATAFVQPAFRVTVPAGTTCDFTLRIASPQLERTGVATSLIKTSGSQGSRIADVVTFSTAAAAVCDNVKGSAVFRGNTGWRSAQARLIRAAAPGAQPAVLAQNANDAVVIGGSTSGALTIKAAAGADIGAAAAWSAAGRAGSVNGDVVVSDAAAMSFDFASLTLGGNTGPPSGTVLLIDEIVIWAERGSDAALRAQARDWQ